MTLVVLGLASFSISRMNVPFKRVFYFFFLMTLFIPATSYMIPNFVNLKELGLLNQYAAFWLPAGANTFYFLLLKNFLTGSILRFLKLRGLTVPRNREASSQSPYHCPFQSSPHWRSLSSRQPGMTGSGHRSSCIARTNIHLRHRSINM